MSLNLINEEKIHISLCGVTFRDGQQPQELSDVLQQVSESLQLNPPPQSMFVWICGITVFLTEAKGTESKFIQELFTHHWSWQKYPFGQQFSPSAQHIAWDKNKPQVHYRELCPCHQLCDINHVLFTKTLNTV